VNDEQLRNLAASVRARLLNHARESRDELQLVLMRYGLERLMYRLSQSEYADEFVVKGAILFLVWTGEAHRSTKDLDLLAIKSASTEELETVFRKVLKLVVRDDGLIFLTNTVRGELIRENDIYQGVRVTLEARLGDARIPLQVDIGFGDVVTPKAGKIIFPTLLEFPSPKLAVYPKETAIAEKFEIMVKLGIANSRMKDYYDVWTLCRKFEFDGELLSEAVRATFQRRQTTLPPGIPLALSSEFCEAPSKQRQWEAFIKRGRLKVPEHDLPSVVAVMREFLGPIASAAANGRTLNHYWPKGGGWKLKL
jgi:predicted nucleotidyltransferase component of viral defense system